MKLSARSLGLTLTLAVAASACATTPAPVASAPAPQRASAPPAPPTLEGRWSLALLRDAPADARVSATLKIEADRAEGATECRSWTAAAPNFGMDLRFESLTDQPLNCDGERKPLEEKFVSALKDVRTVQIRSGYLVLMDSKGRERLYFTRGG